MADQYLERGDWPQRLRFGAQGFILKVIEVFLGSHVDRGYTLGLPIVLARCKGCS